MAVSLYNCPLHSMLPIHGISQQGVWVSFWTPKPLKSTPQDTQIFCEEYLKHRIEFFHYHIIPMTLYKDIKPYFDKYTHVYGWNLSILWSPLKIWTPQKFSIANFRHPVSNSWLRHCSHPSVSPFSCQQHTALKLLGYTRTSLKIPGDVPTID